MNRLIYNYRELLLKLKKILYIFINKLNFRMSYTSDLAHNSSEKRMNNINILRTIYMSNITNNYT